MIRAYENSDYEKIKEWALKVKQCPPPHFLLVRGCFYVEDGVDIACGFVFLEECSPLAVISFVYFNPDANIRKKSHGIKQVYDALEHLAESYDHFMIMTDTSYPSIERILEKKEYMTVLKGASHMVKIKTKDGGA